MSEHLMNTAELIRVAGVLMGAAYADEELSGDERATVYSILGQLVGEQEMPDEVLSFLEDFDPAGFDLEATCQGLLLADREDKRALLSLVAEITEADEVHGWEEDDYLRRVAQAIGATQEDTQGLTMEVVEISTLTLPPPVPEDA
jgi:uncharacterized tellurite resistance protein B-like protein